MATYFESQPVFLESLTDLVSIYFEGFDFVATFHCDSFYWGLRDIVILINALVHSLFWPGLADLRSKRQWEYQRGLSLGEWSMCPFLHFKQHWSSAVISPASVVSADLFRLQSSFSYFYFSPQKTLYLSHCFLLCNTRWRTLIGHFTQSPYSLATLEASL